MRLEDRRKEIRVGSMAEMGQVDPRPQTQTEARVPARADNGERTEQEDPPTSAALRPTYQGTRPKVMLMEWVGGVEGHCGACT